MVTIIGGGIAGTLLAGALGRHDHPVTVYERQQATGPGAFMVLDGHANQTLAALGVSGEALDVASHPVDGIRAHYLPEPANTFRSDGHRLFRRTDLMQVLTEFASAAGANSQYETPVTDVDPANGDIYSGASRLPSDDLVIAADGIDSIARTRLEPGRRPEYAGQIVIYGTVDHPITLPTEPSILHFHGQLGTELLPTSTFGHLWNDHSGFWFARLSRAPIANSDTGFHPVDTWADTVRESAPTAASVIDSLLSATTTLHVSNTRNVPFATAAPPRLPLLLCGDADHAITPAAARGAREAIDDAAALHHALLTNTNPATAMTQRRTRITVERTQSQRAFARTRAADTQR